MNRFVLDASVALAWCFPEERGAYAQAVLDQLRSGHALVPASWSLEIANSLLVAERRQRLAPADVVRFLGLLEALPIEVDTLTATRALRETLALGRARKLAAYDAAYLELAMREAVPLATLDQSLRRAAREAGVKLEGS